MVENPANSAIEPRLALARGVRAMKKSLVVLSSFALIFAGAGMLFRHQARQDTFHEIRVQMNKSEVRRLLGGPFAQPDRTRTLPWGLEEYWLGRDGAILVVFNHDDVLSYKEWIAPDEMGDVFPFDQ
jgi:hypothetical protein